MTKSDPDVTKNEVSSPNALSDIVAIGAASNGAKVCTLGPPNLPQSRCVPTMKLVGEVVPSSALRDFTTIQLGLKLPHNSLPENYDSSVPDHPILDEFTSLHR